MASEKFVMGIFPDLKKVNEVVEELIKEGVDKKEISVITRLSHPEEELIEDVEIKKADRRVLTWAEWGAVAGGLLGLLMGGIVFTAPAAGSMLATGASLSGAINGLLGGAVTGGALFGIADGLAEWGIASEEAKRLQKLVEEGKVLVLVKAESEQAEKVAKILEKAAEKTEILA